jgi:hypothetical protein
MAGLLSITGFIGWYRSRLATHAEPAAAAELLQVPKTLLPLRPIVGHNGF